jgi:hypothetical protein
MLTVISMIVGFVSSLAPEFMKRWQDASDKKHELALTKLQIEATERGYQYKADEIGVEAYRDMVVAAHTEQTETLKSASRWVVDMSASVRPVVTYLFMIAFIGFKMAAFFAAINPNLPWQEGMTYTQAMLAVWGEEETAIFAGIIAYWFGDRAMAKRRAG